MWSNGNSFGNGASVCMADEDRMVMSLPWIWRVQVAGLQGGWPTR